MRQLFLTVIAILLTAAIPCSLPAVPDRGTPGVGRVRVRVTGPSSIRGYYWLDAKTGFREFMEHNLAAVDPNAIALISLQRHRKTLFFGGHQPAGDPAYNIELEEGDSILIPIVD